MERKLDEIFDFFGAPLKVVPCEGNCRGNGRECVFLLKDGTTCGNCDWGVTSKCKAADNSLHRDIMFVLASQEDLMTKCKYICIQPFNEYTTVGKVYTILDIEGSTGMKRFKNDLDTYEYIAITEMGEYFRAQEEAKK